jgi:hypothetical protein
MTKKELFFGYGFYLLNYLSCYSIALSAIGLP